MFANHVGSVLKQALTTFSAKQEHFYQNLEILKVLLDKTTPVDIHLPPQLMTKAIWEQRHKAPVTYIDIFENDALTMGIFVLKPNMKLPLHNHPYMHGLIKVIAGNVKITSYSLNTENTRNIDHRTRASSTRFITAERCSEIFVNEQSDCCLLEPDKGNVHEIQSFNEPAAFIDILSPPYETQIDSKQVRKCSYFQVLCEVKPNVFRLQEVGSPSWYWTDSYPYSGPSLL